MDYENFEFDLYKNQICIEVNKLKSPKEVWFSANKEDMCLAAKTLSKSAFILYMYIISNIDNFKFGIGATPVKEAVGLSASTYQRAMAELKEMKYLTYHQEFVKARNGVTAPKWHFHSRPKT